MKRLIVSTFSALALIVGFTGCITTYRHTQVMSNQTGATVVAVYARDAGTVNWGNARNVTARRNAHGIIRNADGSIAFWDRVNVSSGAEIVLFQYPGHSQTPGSMQNQDIRIIDNNGMMYTRLNVPITFTTARYPGMGSRQVLNRSEPIIFTAQDRHPILTMSNNTGFPIDISAPVSTRVAHGASVMWISPELSPNQNINVTYRIGEVQFDESVLLADQNATVTLTRRPPALIIQNNTGFPVDINAPAIGIIAPGASTLWLSTAPGPAQNIRVAYNVGRMQNAKEVTIGDADVTVSLTTRPPQVTIVNNTGGIIHTVLLRTSGTYIWSGQNMLNIMLNDDGTLADGFTERTILNGDRFSFWMGNVIGIGAGAFDIRVDDVHHIGFLISNVSAQGDNITLTFTQGNRT